MLSNRHARRCSRCITSLNRTGFSSSSTCATHLKHVCNMLDSWCSSIGTPVQHIWGTFVTHLERLCNMLECWHNTIGTLVQHFWSTCVALLLHLCNTFWPVVQHFWVTCVTRYEHFLEYLSNTFKHLCKLDLCKIVAKLALIYQQHTNVKLFLF